MILINIYSPERMLMIISNVSPLTGGPMRPRGWTISERKVGEMVTIVAVEICGIRKGRRKGDIV